MAFVVRGDSAPLREESIGCHVSELLGDNQPTDGRVRIERVRLAAGAQYSAHTGNDELIWIQLLQGSAMWKSSNGIAKDLTTDHVLMIARGAGGELTVNSGADVFIAQVPRAAEYDPTLGESTEVLVDWSTEPVLNSEHDSRRRIYLASPGLWGTHAVKGEMIIYPPGASGAEHHHVGAEHFQFITQGQGTAVVQGEEIQLAAGDLLYNFENEQHRFYNSTDADMIFVEFFVPGESSTVWVPGADVCTWSPTGVDSRGRTPARQLAHHVHGEGDV
jgi:quercetin dioxygenase-like cupin family protein